MAPKGNCGFLCSALSLTLVCLISAVALPAQTPTAVVNGTVVDPSGATVPEAKVTVVNQETNVASQKTTSQDGTFTIINLLPGNYVLTVEKSGFKKVALPVFKLDVNQTLTEQIALQVGDVTETVTVSAESVGVMIQRASTELGTTIDEQDDARTAAERAQLHRAADPPAGRQSGEYGARRKRHRQRGWRQHRHPRRRGLPAFGERRRQPVQCVLHGRDHQHRRPRRRLGRSSRSPTPFRNSRCSPTTTTRNTATCWARW